MTIQAERGSPERVRPVGFCLSDKDLATAKLIARQNNKSFAQYVRDLVVEHAEKVSA